MKTVSSLALGLIALTTFLSIGCAREAEEIADSTSELGTSVPNPSGAYFATIRANGTGCPAGSYEANISPDGKTFTVTFAQFEAQLSPGQRMAIKDCTLAIELQTPQGLSFTVSSFHYQGYVMLTDPGMTAKQTAKYYFMGNPTPATELRTALTGPYDDSYLFTDTLGVVDQVWSPCGASRTLNAQTRLVLQNNAQATGSGYVNTTSVETEMVFSFGLAWRRCGQQETVAIHRAYNAWNSDHVQGTAPNEGAPSWSYEGVGFRLFKDGGEDRSAVYRCLVRGTASHFFSSDSNCEGQQSEGLHGYVSRFPGTGLVPLHRCYGPHNGDHLATIDFGECNDLGLVSEGQYGYALPPDANDSHVVHRSYAGHGDHLFSLTQGEASPNWAYEGVGFRLFAAPGPNRHPLYRCRVNGSPAAHAGGHGAHHFVSGDVRCEGHVREGRLGFASSVPGPGLNPLYRCLSPGGLDHLMSGIGECQGAGFTLEGGPSYVP